MYQLSKYLDSDLALCFSVHIQMGTRKFLRYLSRFPRAINDHVRELVQSKRFLSRFILPNNEGVLKFFIQNNHIDVAYESSPSRVRNSRYHSFAPFLDVELDKDEKERHLIRSILTCQNLDSMIESGHEK